MAVAAEMTMEVAFHPRVFPVWESLVRHVHTTLQVLFLEIVGWVRFGLIVLLVFLRVIVYFVDFVLGMLHRDDNYCVFMLAMVPIVFLKSYYCWLRYS